MRCAVLPAILRRSLTAVAGTAPLLPGGGGSAAARGPTSTEPPPFPPDREQIRRAVEAASRYGVRFLT
jgi:hypothetical protein